MRMASPWCAFYAAPPQRAISLEELEQAALLRLDVLRVLTATPAPERFFRSAQDLPAAARDALALLQADDDRDLVAHYALRLAFCTDRDRLEWLVDAEARLMACRLRSLPTDDVLRILHRHDSNHRPYNREEVAQLSSTRASQWIHQVGVSTDTHFFRIPFQDAARLVGRRQVLLDQGRCWLPARLLYVVAVSRFVSLLRSQLVALFRSLPAKREEMERLQDVISHIYSASMILQQTSSALLSFARQEITVTPQNIDVIAEKHFPLCMKHLHRKMRANHHLKFDGRVQYRVFLKGLGFSVHDSILFFRNEFTKVIPPAKFDREYVYHIRHSYGLEGSRKDYAPMDCQKIIHGGAPRHGQYHGCPFKHWDADTLGNELRRMGVPLSQSERITSMASQGHHESACAALFEALYHRPYQALNETGSTTSVLQMHPNQWVRASFRCAPSSSDE